MDRHRTQMVPGQYILCIEILLFLQDFLYRPCHSFSLNTRLKRKQKKKQKWKERKAERKTRHAQTHTPIESPRWLDRRTDRPRLGARRHLPETNASSTAPSGPEPFLKKQTGHVVHSAYGPQLSHADSSRSALPHIC